MSFLEKIWSSSRSTYFIGNQNDTVFCHGFGQRDGGSVVGVVLAKGGMRVEADLEVAFGGHSNMLEEIREQDTSPSAVGDDAVGPRNSLDGLELPHFFSPYTGTLKPSATPERMNGLLT